MTQRVSESMSESRMGLDVFPRAPMSRAAAQAPGVRSLAQSLALMVSSFPAGGG
jgi:hypothetical protein